MRIEQGRDRNPSVSVVSALADALQLDPTEQEHLRYLAKLSSGSCLGGLAQLRLDVRPTVRTLLDQLEPGIAVLTNRLGDLLAYTRGFDQLAGPTGLLDAPSPNLTRFVFTDRRARNVFPDWEGIAQEQAFDLRLAPAGERSEGLMADLEAAIGHELTTRFDRHQLPDRSTQRWHHPVAGELRLTREVLELPAADAQQLVVLLPADDTTADALTRLREYPPAGSASRTERDGLPCGAVVGERQRSCARRAPSRAQGAQVTYSIRRPEIAREMTSCWICSVPSKMSMVSWNRPTVSPESVKCSWVGSGRCRLGVGDPRLGGQGEDPRDRQAGQVDGGAPGAPRPKTPSGCSR